MFDGRILTFYLSFYSSKRMWSWKPDLSFGWKENQHWLHLENGESRPLTKDYFVDFSWLCAYLNVHLSKEIHQDWEEE